MKNVVAYVIIGERPEGDPRPLCMDPSTRTLFWCSDELRGFATRREARNCIRRHKRRYPEQGKMFIMPVVLP